MTRRVLDLPEPSPLVSSATMQESVRISARIGMIMISMIRHAGVGA